MFYSRIVFPALFQLLLDGPGILKFAGFGLSRVEGENLEELFEQFTEMAGKVDFKIKRPFTEIIYAHSLTIFYRAVAHEA